MRMYKYKISSSGTINDEEESRKKRTVQYGICPIRHLEHVRWYAKKDCFGTVSD